MARPSGVDGGGGGGGREEGRYILGNTEGSSGRASVSVAVLLYPSDPEAGKAGGSVFIGGHACLSLEMLEGGEGGLPT